MKPTKPRYRLGLLPAAMYLWASGVAFGFALFMLAYDPARSELWGVYLVILALPWSGVGVSVRDRLGVMEAFGVGLPFGSLIVCVAINATILCPLGRAIGGARPRPQK